MSYSLIASSAVTKYLWEELVANSILDPTDYYVDDFDLELVPIIPVQDLPQMQNYLGDKTYITYTVIGLPSENGNWFIRTEQVIARVSSPSFAKMAEVVELAVDALGRLDGSALSVNNSAGSSRTFNYHFVETDYEIAAPAQSEGGRMVADITISYQFSRDLNSSGRII